MSQANLFSEGRHIHFPMTGVLKETEKAVLVKINDMKRWIPRKCCILNEMNHCEIWIEEWFVKKMDQTGALFSEDETHRYVLWREWDKTKKIALCIGLNPSRADAGQDDQTIQRLTGALIELGYGGLRMVNLYTIISSDPDILKDDSVRKDSEFDLGIVFTQAMLCQDVIFCWGQFKVARERSPRVLDVFPDALCFGRNDDGSPWHPQAMMYAGLKSEDARLFLFRDHESKNNRYSDKTRRKKMKRAETQIDLLTQKAREL